MHADDSYPGQRIILVSLKKEMEKKLQVPLDLGFEMKSSNLCFPPYTVWMDFVCL